MRIGARISIHIETNNLGYVTGADGGYRVSGEDYMPDVGFISKARHPTRPRETWVPLAPDLAVEVVSPSDSEPNMPVKVANYLVAGTLTLYFFPEEQDVPTYEPGQPAKTLTVNDT